MLDSLDITHISSIAAQLLAPHLRTFLAEGKHVLDVAIDKTIERATEAAGAKTRDLAKRIWELLRPKLGENSILRTNDHTTSLQPEGSQYRVSFEQQLKKILSADRSLAENLSKLIDSYPINRTKVIASGGSIAIGGSVSDSTLTVSRETGPLKKDS